uniref:Uncharacterized protein n=1 Tax=viral metagenome TaxID=1070528 RepID=A0A6C0FKP7_9ZZZZ|tara:strand:- start:2564 stop:3844 length:1281 start_codon:yes stop_codon:yes gene_type:complete
MAKTQRKTKRKKRSKTNKQKRSIRNRREAKKYIELLNHAYKTLTSSYHDLLDKDDYLLLPYLKTGFNRGWKVLKDKNIIKEIKCNSLCMTMSILNSTLGKRKRIDELNPLQKLYLVFISYLVEDGELSKKEVTLKHALKKIDMRIMAKRNDLEKYTKKGDNRNIKKCNKFIGRQEEIKKKLIESDGKDREDVGYAFKIDVCNNVDCEYLHEYQMEKGQKYSESYSKFCLNITEFFKGIVWLNMYQIFGKILNPFKVSINNNVLNININIRNVINKVDIVFLPEEKMYFSDLFYGNNTLDRARKNAIITRKDIWIYNGIDTRNNKLIKRSVHNLENKHYVVAQMNIDSGEDWKKPIDEKAEIIYKNLSNFEKGIGELPILKDIRKQIKKIGDKDKYDLNENIENSITLHWLYMHRDEIEDYIKEFIF